MYVYRTNSGVDPEVVNAITTGVPGAIDELEWNDEQIEALDDSILNGPYGAVCNVSGLINLIICD